MRLKHFSPLAAGAMTVAASALVLAAGGTVSAAASTPVVAATAENSGWARVAHLSPDTKSVDVQLTALAGGQVVYELNDVGYGGVSDYQFLPEGTYVVSMVPAGAADDAEPVISESVDVRAGQPLTIAALGPNDDLDTKVFRDDLTAPPAGEARIRVVQASTIAETVDIRTADGLVLADDAEAGTATGYATVPAGPWDLELTSGSTTAAANVTLAAGTVSTLFVLDNASGGLTIKAVLDSAAVAQAPVGGVPTGGGAMSAAVATTLPDILTKRTVDRDE